MTTNVELRDVTESDLAIFFAQQLDPEANRMAGFTAADPTDRAALAAKWAKALADPAAMAKTILYGGRVAGCVTSFIAPWSGQQEVSYWIGREHWGCRRPAVSRLDSSRCHRG